MATGLLLGRFDYLLTSIVTFVGRQMHNDLVQNFSTGPVQGRYLHLVKVPI